MSEVLKVVCPKSLMNYPIQLTYLFYIFYTFSLKVAFPMFFICFHMAKIASSIQYGYIICGIHAELQFITLSHGNSKKEDSKERRNVENVKGARNSSSLGLNNISSLPTPIESLLLLTVEILPS